MMMGVTGMCRVVPVWRVFFLFTLCLILTAPPSPASAAASQADIQAAERLIRELSDQAISILKQQNASLEMREAALRYEDFIHTLVSP